MKLRIGHGFDVHRFAELYDPEQPLVLGGVTLDAPRSLEAHSDGDVVIHALCDAMLGAIAAGDIGQHFPDDDERFAGADSADLLMSVLALCTKQALAPVNVDLTIIAQAPRLSPHRQAMVERLATLLGVQQSQVNVKATTTEGLGYLGREEGIACHAVVLLGGDD